MKTYLTKSIKDAARYLKNGGTVAFPTETVYGLGANVFDAEAIAKIFVAKQRPADNPLIAHIADFEQIELLVLRLTPAAERFIAAFFPAPLTLVLPKSAQVPLAATANLDTIGVRMPNHAVALDFLRECQTPVVAPSANLSGKPSPTTWQAVYEDLNERIDCILQGEQTEVGLESTVVECTGDAPLILRVGAITLEDLQRVVPETAFAAKDTAQTVRSPGLRYKHYTPNAKVILISSPDEINDVENAGFIGMSVPLQIFTLTKICVSATDYAHSLFAFFRECDAHNIKKIYCQTVAEQGMGLALMDRLRRAAF